MSVLSLSRTASQHQRLHQSSPGPDLPPPPPPPPPLLPQLSPQLPCRVNYTDAVGPLRGSAASSKPSLTFHCNSLVVQCAHWRPTIERSVVPESFQKRFFFCSCSIAAVSKASAIISAVVSSAAVYLSQIVPLSLFSFSFVRFDDQMRLRLFAVPSCGCCHKALWLLSHFDGIALASSGDFGSNLVLRSPFNVVIPECQPQISGSSSFLCCF